MAEKITADTRDTFGKGAARKLRAAGRIPAVIYGHGSEPVHISLPAHEMLLITRRANPVLELDLAGKPQLALVKDVQRDPVRQIIEHVDLVVMKKGEKVQVEIPVHVTGESAPGTIATLDAQTLLLEVEFTAIPTNIEVDVEGAEDGTHITAADVKLPKGATLISDPELLVIGIATAPAAEAEAGEAAESTEAEPAAE